MKGLNHLVTFHLFFNGLSKTDTANATIKPEQWTGAYLVLFFVCLIIKYFKYIFLKGISRSVSASFSVPEPTSPSPFCPRGLGQRARNLKTPGL